MLPQAHQPPLQYVCPFQPFLFTQVPPSPQGQLDGAAEQEAPPQPHHQADIYILGKTLAQAPPPIQIHVHQTQHFIAFGCVLFVPHIPQAPPHHQPYPTLQLL